MVDQALVLEGGALRSLYTAGVLDVFLENDLRLPYIIGVSAGSLTALNYVSQQRGRTARINIDYVNDPRYIGVRNFLHGKDLFNLDFLFNEIDQEVEPFDHEAFFSSNQRVVAVATNCETGEAEYFERAREEIFYDACKASCSIPMVSKMKYIDEIPYLDGGIAAPVGIEQAIKEKARKIILVLTRQKGFRKSPVSRIEKKLYSAYYYKYPKLVEKLAQIPDNYNSVMDQIDDLEKKGDVFIIRPKEPVSVSRTERDAKKLQKLYQIGKEEALERLPLLCEYLKS